MAVREMLNFIKKLPSSAPKCAYHYILPPAMYKNSSYSICSPQCCQYSLF